MIVLAHGCACAREISPAAGADAHSCGCRHAHLALVAVLLRIVVEVGLLLLELHDPPVLEHLRRVERQHVGFPPARRAAASAGSGRGQQAERDGAREGEVGDIMPRLPLSDALEDVLAELGVVVFLDRLLFFSLAL